MSPLSSVDRRKTLPSPVRDFKTADDDDRQALGRKYGVRDAAFQAASQGGGENYFSAFAVLLHASPFQIGVLSALPQLIGTVAQLSSVKLLQYFGMPGRLIKTGGTGASPLLAPSTHSPSAHLGLWPMAINWMRDVVLRLGAGDHAHLE